MNPISHFGAWFAREIKIATLCWHLLLLVLLAPLLGVLALKIGRDDGIDQSLFLLLQFALYLIPLVSLGLGVGMVHNDSEEEALLLTQPSGASTRVLGKFAALTLMIVVGVSLLLIPVGLAGAGPNSWMQLWLHAVALGLVFGSLGLALGSTLKDRLIAYQATLGLWIVFLLGSGIVALVLVRSGAAEDAPEWWSLLLMLNPIEVMRIDLLLLLGRVPLEQKDLPHLLQWWRAHPSIWLGISNATWTVLALLWTRWRLSRPRRG